MLEPVLLPVSAAGVGAHQGPDSCVTPCAFHRGPCCSLPSSLLLLLSRGCCCCCCCRRLSGSPALWGTADRTTGGTTTAQPVQQQAAGGRVVGSRQQAPSHSIPTTSKEQCQSTRALKSSLQYAPVRLPGTEASTLYLLCGKGLHTGLPNPPTPKAPLPCGTLQGGFTHQHHAHQGYHSGDAVKGQTCHQLRQHCRQAGTYTGTGKGRSGEADAGARGCT